MTKIKPSEEDRSENISERISIGAIKANGISKRTCITIGMNLLNVAGMLPTDRVSVTFEMERRIVVLRYDKNGYALSVARKNGSFKRNARVRFIPKGDQPKVYGSNICKRVALRRGMIAFKIPDSAFVCDDVVPVEAS